MDIRSLFFYYKSFVNVNIKLFSFRVFVGERDVTRNVISCRCTGRLPLTHTGILLYRSVSLRLRARHFGCRLIELVLLYKAVSSDEPHQGDCKNHCHNAAKTKKRCNPHFTALICWSFSGRRST